MNTKRLFDRGPSRTRLYVLLDDSKKYEVALSQQY